MAARPNRDDYPPGDAGNVAFDKADFDWQMANNKGAKQNVSGQAGKGLVADPNYRSGAHIDTGVAPAPIGDVSGTGLGTAVDPDAPVPADIPMVGQGMAAEAARNKAWKIVMQKWATDPVFKAEWKKTHAKKAGGGAVSTTSWSDWLRSPKPVPIIPN